MSSRRRRARGMTLIEIMVVLVILGMLSSIIGVSVFHAKRQAEIDDARLNVAKLRDAVELYRLRHPSLPDGLAVLEDKEIRRLRADPWGKPYAYVREGDRFEIRSLGPDRVLSDDDVVEDVARTDGH